MLTQLREGSTGSLMIFILFGMLIFVFIFFFGPQSQGFQPGSGAGVMAGTAATVNGQEVPAKHIEIALRKQFGFGNDVEKDELGRLRHELVKQTVDQVLVEQRARAAGIAVGEDELSRFIISKDNPDFPYFADQNGNFSAQRYQDQVTQGFGATTAEYREIKEREVLANRYLRFLSLQVKVSDPAIREAFDRAKRSWDLAFLVADPAHYAAQAAKPTAADGAAFAKANPDAVKTYYDDHKDQYDRDTEVRVRRILVKIPKDASDTAKAEAKTKIEGLRAKVIAEGGDFAAVATESSEGYYKTQGGDMGWQRKKTTTAEDYEVYAKLTKGQVSEVRETPIGYSIVKADDVRPEIRKTLAEVTDEIGLELATLEGSKKLARAAAEGWLASAKGGKTLEDIAKAANPMPTPAPAPAAVEDGEDGVDGEDDDPEGTDDAVAQALPTPPNEGPKVEVLTTGDFGDNRPAWDVIPSIGKAPDLASGLAKLTEEAPLFDSVIEVDDRFYVVRLAKRTEPNAEDFAKEKDRLALDLRGRRMNQMFGNWQAMVLGPLRQREVAERLGGGNMLASLIRDGANIKINEDIYPATAPAVPAVPAP